MGSLDLSIVIPVYNHAPDLDELLTALETRDQGGVSYEVIVVDDASTEDVAGVCQQHGVRYHRLEVGKGPAHARNIGAEMARADIIAFFDADIVPPEGMLSAACAVLKEEQDSVGVSFINQAYKQGDSLVRNYGAAIEHFWFRKMIDDGDGAKGEIRGLTTRNGVVRREAFEAIDGFDVTFRTNAIEDYDLGKRLAQKGRAFLLGHPIVYHKFPDGLGRLLRNYWVRVTLFVPYQLQHRHPADKAQTSTGEGLIRLLGMASLLAILIGAAPIPFRHIYLGVGLLASAAYFLSIRGFLLACWRSSRRISFPVAASLIHYLSSLVIVAGACWGLVSHVTARAPDLGRKE